MTGYQTLGGVKYKFNSYGANASKLAIDVSSHNGNINWAKVRASGVEYAIIRVGYRGYRNGNLMSDINFKANIDGALKNGIQVGLYFYSQAVNNNEAIEEASLAVNAVKGYSVKLPIYFDTEFTEMANTTNPGRADVLTSAQRTAIAKTFCETVRGAGYQAGIYASKFFYYDNLIYNQLSSYHIWLAHYTSNGATTDFKYNYSMWQYTEKGKIDGISTNVDVNICLYDFVNKNDMSKLGENIIFV